jgi:hypothetical protein
MKALITAPIGQVEYEKRTRPVTAGEMLSVLNRQNNFPAARKPPGMAASSRPD